MSSADTCGGALARRGSGRPSLHIGLPEFARSLHGILPLVCQNCLLMWAPRGKRKKKKRANEVTPAVYFFPMSFWKASIYTN